MIPVKCESPACRSSLHNFTKTFYVESMDSECPSCGLTGSLRRCEQIHLLVPSLLGAIVGEDGQHYKFGCKSSREGYNRHYQHPTHPRFYSPVPRAVTCPDCLFEYGASLIEGELVRG